LLFFSVGSGNQKQNTEKPQDKFSIIIFLFIIFVNRYNLYVETHTLCIYMHEIEDISSKTPLLNAFQIDKLYILTDLEEQEQ